MQRSCSGGARADVVVGGVAVGGGAPIVVQSMTNTDTADVDGHRRAGRGARARRLGARAHHRQHAEAAAAVPQIRERLDAHGLSTCRWSATSTTTATGCSRSTRSAREALAKFRINPGNVGKGAKRDEQFATMIECALRVRQAGAHRRQLGQPRPGAAGAHDGRERAARGAARTRAGVMREALDQLGARERATAPKSWALPATASSCRAR